MASRQDRRIQILVAIIAAVSAIAVAVIQLSTKKESTTPTSFKANDINNSSVIIGNGNNTNKQ